MTITQAHQFIGRWRRIFIPWPSPHTDTDAARALERSFLGIAICPLPIFFMAIFIWHIPLSHIPLSAIIPTVIGSLLCRWFGTRFGVARRLLELAEAQHLSDLREHIYDKPVA